MGKSSIILIIVLAMCFSTPSQSIAQEVDEVALTFAFPAIGQVYVSSVFRGIQPLLPVSELLSLFLISHDRVTGTYGFKGMYPDKSAYWEINPANLSYTVRGQKKSITADQVFIGESDLFVTPDLYQDIFDITFTINPYSLTLSIQKNATLPIEEFRKREEVRKRLRDQAPENLLTTFPLLYPRQRKLFAPGMLDYNVGFGTGVGNEGDFRQYTIGLNAGLEFLGGDLQGGIGVLSSGNSLSTRLSPVRWRYVFQGGVDPAGIPAISELSVGQIGLTGPYAGRILGASITNNPIVPRRVLDIFVIEGNTVPDSEIELLIGGQLVDFVRADEVGYYRFNTPLTYGNIRIGLRIYTPQGEVIMEDRQLQIPFNFVPRGVLTYNIQAGFEDFGPFGIDTSLIGHGSVSYGLTNNITIQAGANRLNDLSGSSTKPYGSVSLRVFDQFLVNAEVQPGRFYRASGSVIYANNTALTAQYTEFSGQSQMNRLGEQRVLGMNYFFPVNIRNRPSGLRLGLDRAWFVNGEITNWQVDVNTRIGPLVTRLNYREQINTRVELLPNNEPARLATAILTYTVPRKPGLPVFVRGMFLRTSLRHDMKRLDATALASLQFSQTVFKRGRLTLGFDRDVLLKQNMFQVGLLYDFNSIRSSTQGLALIRGNTVIANINQNFSGSIGADARNGVLVPTNRDQVGRAGATVRMFVDNNANGLYDSGEEIITSRAIRLDQSANILVGSDGMIRITQLQSYWTYRLSVDVKSLPDPTLMPLKDKFSFVADPNRFKLIDIPLYRTGTIEGTIWNEDETGRKQQQPGIRLYAYMEGSDEPLPVIRSLSDGSFYANGLIPGNYFMLVDSTQLKFMNKLQAPDTLKFTIRPTAEGDWIDTLSITLVPRPPDSTKSNEPMTLAQLESLLGQKLRTAIKAFSESQELFYRGKLDQALVMADSSLREFPSDFAIAMRGSIVYMQGDKNAALNLWAQANERNPFVSIPDTARLKLKVEQSLPEELVEIPVAPSPADSITLSHENLVAELEAELGEKLRHSVAAFIAAQESFYSLDFEMALSHIDTSLSYNRTDHALALKGSIVYILGRKSEAWQLWYEARERNPMITLPDTELLERLMSPVAEETQRNGRKKLISNR